MEVITAMEKMHRMVLLRKKYLANQKSLFPCKFYLHFLDRNFSVRLGSGSGLCESSLSMIGIMSLFMIYARIYVALYCNFCVNLLVEMKWR